MRKTEVFRIINLTTIIAVYFLILVGGIVRSVGAGMGCPDWPKCFGQYMPPSSVSELPDNYVEIFTEKRLEKSHRLANVLAAVGMTNTAEMIRTTPEVVKETTYSYSKAWIEYVNRLIGVLIGFLIILNCLWSLKLRKQDWRLALLGVLALILVLFQGWVGSLVVATNLLPGFITFHMILALVLVAMLLAQRAFLMSHTVYYSGKILTGVLLVAFFLQIILGTGVREQIDAFVYQDLARADWVGNLGTKFYIHRSFSILILLLVGGILWLNRHLFFRYPMLPSILTVIGLEILLGMILAYMDVPAIAQPVHLLLGSIGFGLIFYLFLSTRIRPVITS